MELLASPAFWAALGNILLVNIVLSADNAVVIALATRRLEANHQRNAIIWGSAAVIVMRVVLTIFAIGLLEYPYLKMAGGLLVLYIGVQLLSGGDRDEATVVERTVLWAAIWTILMADLIMSIDNVIAVAAAAKGNVILLVIGLAISIPLIVFASTRMLKLMERFPIIITIGAMLLGYLAGEMFFTDAAITGWVDANLPHLDLHVIPGTLDISIPGAIGAIIVYIVGKWMQRATAAHVGAVAQ